MSGGDPFQHSSLDDALKLARDLRYDETDKFGRLVPSNGAILANALLGLYEQLEAAREVVEAARLQQKASEGETLVVLEDALSAYDDAKRQT